VFDKISRRQHPDGVAVVAAIPDLSFSGFEVADPALVLVADGMEKPGNIGAILRTCDALGASFIGSSLATDLVNPNVVRSAQGSLFSTPTASVPRTDAIRWCAANTKVFVTRPDNSESVWNVDLTAPTSVVVGAEDAGVAGAWAEVGAGLVIPMSGSADSMNASVSAAIVIAEARRQRSI
jgi:TrmH family RNA methyltransferase